MKHSSRLSMRSSYKFGEVIWGAKFSTILHSDQGKMIVHLHRIHDIERVPS